VQLHQLAGIVLIDPVEGIPLVVEITQHCG
jgi:hypothetical protein